MNVSFTRAWARVLTVIGTVVIVLGVVAAILAVLFAPASALDPFGGAAARQILGLPPAGAAESAVLRVFAACTVVLAGLVVGGPMIVSGELILIFLEQRALLARQRSLLAKILRKLPDTRGEPPPRAADERFRWRR